MQNLFKDTFKITSYEVNPHGKARLTTIANYFQEIAYLHAGKLGFGYEDLKKDKVMWVLSRMKIRMDQYPSWDEKITIETWPSGVDKLFAMRDFRVVGSEGDTLGSASTAWLILDINTRRPERPGQRMEAFSEKNNPVFDSGLERISLPEELDLLSSHEVQYSDLDIVGHVNNVKYMEWCLDALMNGESIKQQVREFEINFMSEALQGETIHLYIAQDRPEISARNLEPEREVFRARVIFE